jgi:hypothetical protein
MADPFAPYNQPGRGFTTFNPNVTPSRENNWGFGFGITPTVPGGSTTYTPPPNLAGAINPLAPVGGSEGAGRIPRVPDPKTTARNATRGNIANLPAITNLANQVNTFNLDQLLKRLETTIPGYQGLQAKAAENLGAALRGEVPADVRNQILTNAAEYGLGSGTGGGLGALSSTLAGNMGLRSLGLTSLARQDKGEELFTSMTNRAPKVTPFDIAKQFVTPGDQQAAETLAAILAAAPDPAKAMELAQALAKAGLLTGLSATRTTGGGGAPPPPSSNLASILEMLQKYQGGITPPPSTTPPPTTPPPTTPPPPGWGYAPGSGGGTTQFTGNVPWGTGTLPPGPTNTIPTDLYV